MRPRPCPRFDAATALTEKVKQTYPPSHPDAADLGFLYGTILTDGGDGANGVATKNVCVFADAEVDRSPTGSGVTARLAAMHAKGEIGIDETRLFESIVGSRFTGSVARQTSLSDGRAAIVAQVGGRAHYSGVNSGRGGRRTRQGLSGAVAVACPPRLWADRSHSLNLASEFRIFRRRRDGIRMARKRIDP